MGADVYIHVIPKQPVVAEFEESIGNGKFRTRTIKGFIDNDVLSTFFSNTIGSKWFSFSRNNIEQKKWKRAYNLIARTPSVYIGEVSWLKAAFLDDEEQYVPTPIREVVDVIGEDLPVINDKLIEKISEAMRKENKTDYKINDPETVIKFLQEHKGLQCFTVSW